MLKVLLHMATEDFANELQVNAASESSHMPQG